MSNSLLLLLFYFSLKGWVREGTHTHTHVCGVTSMSKHTPRSLPVPDGSAAGPTCQKTTRAHLCVELLVIIICSVPPYLLFNFFLHEQQLSMLWHFNSTAKSPPPQPHTHTTYLSPRTHQKLVQSFLPSHYFPSYFPFPFFNNQGHSNNCRVGWRGR